MLNWKQFFDRNRIAYDERGPNVSAGNIAIHCPWCGSADPSKHLTVSLRGYGFSCWRHPKHRGTNPARLIQALLKFSWQQACELAGVKIDLPDDFMAQMREKLSSKVTEQKSVRGLRRLIKLGSLYIVVLLWLIKYVCSYVE